MLVKDEATARPEESSDLRNRFGKFGNVMEGPAGHDSVEGIAGCELPQRHGLKELAFGGVGIDCDHLVAQLGQSARKVAVPATHFQYPGGPWREVAFDERLELHDLRVRAES